MPFTADHGVTRREEILQTKLLQHPASYYSSMHKFSENDPFFHKCLQRQTAWLGASFYKSVGLEASEFKDYEVWSSTFVYSVTHLDANSTVAF